MKVDREVQDRLHADVCASDPTAWSRVFTTLIDPLVDIDVVTLLRGSGDRAVFPSPERAIRAEGNLKSDKFDDIVTRLGLDATAFELHYNWLDAELLRRRNDIAHGAIGYTDKEFGQTHWKPSMTYSRVPDRDTKWLGARSVSHAIY